MVESFIIHGPIPSSCTSVFRVACQLSSEPRASCGGQRPSTASSDGKAASSKRWRENHDRRGTVGDAYETELKKKERKLFSGACPRLPRLIPTLAPPSVSEHWQIPHQYTQTSRGYA